MLAAAIIVAELLQVRGALETDGSQRLTPLLGPYINSRGGRESAPRQRLAPSREVRLFVSA